MINTVFFGINIILLFYVWKFILRPSILDYFRDRLFDLREEVRDFYILKNIPLSDNTYKSLRDLLNNHLRFTEKLSLSNVFYFSAKIDKNIELKNFIKHEIENKFKTDDERLSIFIKKARLTSSRILIYYMIFSSPLLILLFSSILVYRIPLFMAGKIISSINDEIKLISSTLRGTSEIVNKYITTNDDLEELSYKLSNGDFATAV